MPAPALGVRPRWAPHAAARVDPSHPLSQGLWFYAPSSLPGRAAGSMSWGSSLFGPCAQSATDNDCYAVPIPKLPGSITEFTVHTVKSQTSMGAWAVAAGVPAPPQSGTWASPYWVVAMANSAGGTNTYLHTNNAGTILSTTLPSAVFLADGLTHSYTGQWGVGGAAVYRDGVVIDTSATQPNGASAWTPSAVVGTPETVFLGRSASAPGEGFTGRHVLSIVWLRRLSPVEVALVHADPFVMLAR